MPKFKNLSEHDRVIPALGVTVKAGESFDCPDGEVEGFAGQDDIWEPVGTQAKHAVKEAATHHAS